MIVDYDDPSLPQRLRDFEQLVAGAFNAGDIRAPVHLSGGYEEQLIEYFRSNYSAERGDWICTTWRSHYHCFLAGVDPDRLYRDILAGKSITLTYPDHRIISSAIVGGVLPIALGLATGIRRRVEAGGYDDDPSGDISLVHAFVGDMTARGGIFHEVMQYAGGHALPLSFVIEDNEKSVGTPTDHVWGNTVSIFGNGPRMTTIRYTLPWPHAGAGQWVRF